MSRALVQSVWARARDARYALPGWIEAHHAGPVAASTASLIARLTRRGIAATPGYFQATHADPQTIAQANAAMLMCLTGDAYLSVKAPPMRFDPGLLGGVAMLARDVGRSILLDAHAPKDADATLGVLRALLPDHPATGVALPTRWARTARDAAALRDTGARIRLVRGEWADADPAQDDPSAQAYLAVVRLLAGRRAPVAVATHRPDVAQAALRLLRDSGTPVELEQLRGLPRRATMAVARHMGVGVRVYVPFGPGWWPYAVDKALARPDLPLWALRDWLGGARLGRALAAL
ncbi:proline dehydrogenase [Novosphingobium sp. FSY-8]|uniref:Proline dehydrogenase n=1 Tax=Novosphingobium ovatum TaxID=1908523 RepID=A0ABW9XG62_9SPHN|nr:proline dehydrogenase family protein [Novosphingobium ovatum]NBC37537.1 proline dehydrogenase [Novosphingobium ovatum]